MEIQRARLAWLAVFTACDGSAGVPIGPKHSDANSAKALCEQLGMTYSVFMNGPRKAEIEVDRKVLADLAVHDKAAFAKIAEQAKASRA